MIFLTSQCNSEFVLKFKKDLYGEAPKNHNGTGNYCLTLSSDADVNSVKESLKNSYENFKKEHINE